MKPQPLIDSEFLRKLERLAIYWQRSFHGLVGGHNLSRFAGPGQEFFEHRHFHQGDDLRAVNWRAYLRLEKLFLKMFQIEPRVPVRLLLDVSRSMKTGEASKFDYARRLAAAIAYVGLVRLDSICIQPFADGLLDPLLCGGGRHRFAPVADFLTRLEPGKATNFLQATREFAGRYPQRGLLVVISDFLDEHDPRRPLEYLAEFGHELLLVHVWAAEDREPPWDGQLQFIDAETEQTVDMAFDEEARRLHASAFDEFARDLQHLALTKSGRYASLPTGVPVEDAIFGPLAASGAVQ